MLKTANGEPGWLCTFYTVDSNESFKDPVSECVLNDTRVKLNDALPRGLGDEWGIKLKGLLTVSQSAHSEFGLAVAGENIHYLCKFLLIAEQGAPSFMLMGS